MTDRLTNCLYLLKMWIEGKFIRYCVMTMIGLLVIVAYFSFYVLPVDRDIGENVIRNMLNILLMVAGVVVGSLSCSLNLISYRRKYEWMEAKSSHQ